jgi:hypothetical protein
MKITLNTRYFPAEPATIRRGKYHNGETALVLDDAAGLRLATATVCLEQYNEHPAEGNVIIKDYSENEGILACLVAQGVISEPVRSIQSGWVNFYECKLLVTLPDLS